MKDRIKKAYKSVFKPGDAAFVNSGKLFIEDIVKTKQYKIINGEEKELEFYREALSNIWIGNIQFRDSKEFQGATCVKQYFVDNHMMIPLDKSNGQLRKICDEFVQDRLFGDNKKLIKKYYPALSKASIAEGPCKQSINFLFAQYDMPLEREITSELKLKNGEIYSVNKEYNFHIKNGNDLIPIPGAVTTTYKFNGTEFVMESMEFDNELLEEMMFAEDLRNINHFKLALENISDIDAVKDSIISAFSAEALDEKEARELVKTVDHEIASYKGSLEKNIISEINKIDKTIKFDMALRFSDYNLDIPILTLLAMKDNLEFYNMYRCTSKLFDNVEFDIEYLRDYDNLLDKIKQSPTVYNALREYYAILEIEKYLHDATHGQAALVKNDPKAVLVGLVELLKSDAGKGLPNREALIYSSRPDTKNFIVRIIYNLIDYFRKKEGRKLLSDIHKHTDGFINEVNHKEVPKKHDNVQDSKAEECKGKQP